MQRLLPTMPAWTAVYSLCLQLQQRLLSAHMKGQRLKEGHRPVKAVTNSISVASDSVMYELETEFHLIIQYTTL